MSMWGLWGSQQGAVVLMHPLAVVTHSREHGGAAAAVPGSRSGRETRVAKGEAMRHEWVEKCWDVAWRWTCLAGICWLGLAGCGAAPSVPEVPTGRVETTVEEATQPSCRPGGGGHLFDGAVRSASLLTAGNGVVAVFAFDTEQAAYLMWPDAAQPVRVAMHAQVACLDVSAGGVVSLATIERAQDLPTTRLVVRHYSAQGEAVGTWSPESPELWPEPGSRCAWIHDASGEVAALLSRSRAAEPGAPLELWLSGPGRDGVPFGLGPHVPAIEAAHALPGAALVVLSRVESDAEQRRVLLWWAEQIDDQAQRVELTAATRIPVGIGVESRTKIISQWVSPLTLPTGFAPLFVGVRTQASSVHSPDRKGWGPALHSALRAPVNKGIAAPATFFRGRWWVALRPDPTLYHARRDLPYREWVVALDEGVVHPLRLPEGLYHSQLLPGEHRWWLVALGAPVAESFDLSQGLFLLHFDGDEGCLATLDTHFPGF